MSDDDAFNKITRRLRRHEKAQRKKARQEMAVICDRLTVLGVTRVAIAYDGYGDEGAVQSVFAFTGDEEVKLASDIVEALSDAASFTCCSPTPACSAVPTAGPASWAPLIALSLKTHLRRGHLESWILTHLEGAVRLKDRIFG